MSEHELWMKMCFILWAFNAMSGPEITSAGPKLVALACLIILQSNIKNTMRSQIERDTYHPRLDLFDEYTWDTVCDLFPDAFYIRMLYV